MVKVKLLALLPVLAVGLALAGAAAADPPPLYVTFRPDHSFFVYLPNGTQVGTTNGAASVIAAGSYTLLLDDTAAVDMPFDLSGPGVKLVTDMAHAEEVSDAVVVTFQPNSTYTYRDDNHPNVFWTFTTSSQVLPPSPTTTTTCSSCTVPTKTTGTGDIVGSQTVIARGSLAGAVSAAGRLALTFKGKAVGTLKAGSYKLTVLDRSSSRGFTVQRAHDAAQPVTGLKFVGARHRTITLSAGQWAFFSPGAGKKTYFFVSK